MAINFIILNAIKGLLLFFFNSHIMLLMGWAYTHPKFLKSSFAGLLPWSFGCSLKILFDFCERYIKLPWLWTLLNLILFDFNHLSYQSFLDLLSNLCNLIYRLYLSTSCQLHIWDSCYYIVIQAIAEWVFQWWANEMALQHQGPQWCW